MNHKYEATHAQQTPFERNRELGRQLAYLEGLAFQTAIVSGKTRATFVASGTVRPSLFQLLDRRVLGQPAGLIQRRTRVAGRWGHLLEARTV